MSSVSIQSRLSACGHRQGDAARRCSRWLVRAALHRDRVLFKRPRTSSSKWLGKSRSCVGGTAVSVLADCMAKGWEVAYCNFSNTV